MTEETRPANNTEKSKTANQIYEISLLDLFTVLVQKRRFIAKIACRFALIAIVYSLIATPVYKSELQIMPSGGQQAGGAMAMLAASGLGNLVGAGMATTADTVVGVIKSPAVLDRVIDSKQLLTRESEGWSLKKLFGMSTKPKKPRSREKTRNALSKQISASADIKTGLISLSVSARTPEFSAEMTQAVFDETQNMMQTLSTSPSAQSRMVLERQLKDAGDELYEAGKELAKYNIKKTLAGETPADVTSLTKMQSMMLAKEVELRTVRRFGTDNNPKVKQIQAEYDSMKRKFANDFRLEDISSKKGDSEAFNYNAKLRDYRLKEATYNALLAQLENAKVTEDDQPLVIQQIGNPTLPEKRSKPQRKKIVILATMLGIFVGVFAAFAQHFYELGKKDKETAGQMDYIVNAFKQDLKLVKRKVSHNKCDF